MIHTVATGANSAAAAALSAMRMCVRDRSAVPPSRYTATPNTASTIGPRPYSAPRTHGLTPSAAYATVSASMIANAGAQKPNPARRPPTQPAR